jgi:hypothetical protein
MQCWWFLFYSDTHLGLRLTQSITALPQHRRYLVHALLQCHPCLNCSLQILLPQRPRAPIEEELEELEGGVQNKAAYGQEQHEQESQFAKGSHAAYIFDVIDNNNLPSRKHETEAALFVRRERESLCHNTAY